MFYFYNLKTYSCLLAQAFLPVKHNNRLIKGMYFHYKLVRLVMKSSQVISFNFTFKTQCFRDQLSLHPSQHMMYWNNTSGHTYINMQTCTPSGPLPSREMNDLWKIVSRIKCKPHLQSSNAFLMHLVDKVMVLPLMQLCLLCCFPLLCINNIIWSMTAPPILVLSTSCLA